MGWLANQQFRRWRRIRLWGIAFLSCTCFFLFTPRIPRSPRHHQFIDMRNLLGVPNTLNVITNFPFLIVGVLGFVLALEGGLFNTSSKSEARAWILFYAGTAATAFGSAYYHLKPDDTRVFCDTLPIIVTYSSLLSSLLIERIGQRTGLCCMFSLLLAALLCVAYERIYNDIRFCMIYQLILPVAIPGVAFFCSSIYTHSSYWFWSTGIYLLAKFEAVADRKLCLTNNFIISGHSLQHFMFRNDPSFTQCNAHTQES